MTDFSELVAELKAMAIREEAAERRPAQPVRNAAVRFSKWESEAANFVREAALRHPDWRDNYPIGAGDDYRAAVDVARVQMADEVIEIQRRAYRNARMRADEVDARNAANPEAKEAYPVLISTSLEWFSHLMSDGQED